ncbi:MAG: hypothetical protein HC817_02875 [Saprospiraceae bacterium]|nr:hypothetical protein [Saprospiraceae bacterium]
MQYLFKSEDQEVDLTTPNDTVAEFSLLYKKLIIGTLKLDNGIWSFAYSNEFKGQEEISPIVDFPNKNKIYQTRNPFPLFLSRIPSLQRLKIQHIIPQNFTTDDVSLLKLFGKQSITNPYQLIPQS